jgi:hypothetical protein
MEGGVSWWKQIEEALDQVRFLVIVMTPEAMQSEMTRKEWRYARQRGVNIYPVKGCPDQCAKLDEEGAFAAERHLAEAVQKSRMIAASR